MLWDAVGCRWLCAGWIGAARGWTKKLQEEMVVKIGVVGRAVEQWAAWSGKRAGVCRSASTVGKGWEGFNRTGCRSF